MPRMTPITREQAQDAAMAWIRAQRPDYGYNEEHWLLAPLARVLRTGIDQKLAWDLVVGSELAYETWRNRDEARLPD